MPPYQQATLEEVLQAPTEKVFVSDEPIVISGSGDGGVSSPLSVITDPIAQFTGDIVGTGTGAISDVTGTVTQATTSATGNLIDGASVLPGIGGISTFTLLLVGLAAFLLLRK